MWIFIKRYLLMVTLPLFADLPVDLAANLDVQELKVPFGKVEKYRKILEQSLRHYVVCYNKGMFLSFLPAERHVCANIKSASLKKSQKQLLSQYEKLVEGSQTSFVVYQKPLELVDPKTSLFGKALY